MDQMKRAGLKDFRTEEPLTLNQTQLVDIRVRRPVALKKSLAQKLLQVPIYWNKTL